ncbi:MAG: sugar ABC transporter permease [Firmicutes bacterium]|nr:sugar ABC transporter permease [Bacillota bacterium]
MAISNRILSHNMKRELCIIKKDYNKRKLVYLMLMPVLSFYIIFHYWPMYGAIIAFKQFSPGKGIFASPWVGFENFQDFFNSYYCWRLIRNTLLINVYQLIFAFPAPIIFAFLLNEVKDGIFKRTVQTVSYLPHFISLIVVCGMLVDFLSIDGVVNDIIEMFGGQRISLLLQPSWFRAIYVSSGIWQHMGWDSIIYLASLSSIDPQLYEAIKIDGGGRLRQLWHISLPGIAPTIIILLILKAGQMMNVGFEKVFLLYNPNTYETADVISTFVYRKGLLEMNFSYSAAVGLFNSVINFVLLVLSNKISKVTTETSLW